MGGALPRYHEAAPWPPARPVDISRTGVLGPYTCYIVCNMSIPVTSNAHNVSPAPDLDALYALAEPRAGYFTSREATQAGYSRSLLAHHVSSGLFERVERGIYKLRRYPESPRADLFIAELRAGAQGAVSHESALELYDLSDVLPAEVHVTVPRTASRRRHGVILHTGRLERDDVTTWDGVCVTTVERTIADVARAGLAEELVLGAINQALQRGLTTRSRLACLAERRGGRTKRLVRRALGATP